MIWISTCAAAAMRCQARSVGSRPYTEPSTQISITGDAPLVVIGTERKARGEAT
jgi:hypothetical protein